MAIYNVGVNMTWRNQRCVNVHHYTTQNALDATQLQELADDIRSAYALLNVTDHMDNAWSVDFCNIRRVDVGDLPGATVTFTSGVLGGSTTDPNQLANQTAALVSFYAPTTKPRRGRTYIPGVHSKQLADTGFWSSALQTAMDNWATAIIAIALTGDTATKCAVQYSGTPSAVSLFNAFQSYVVRANPAVQRSRRIGIGV